MSNVNNKDIDYYMSLEYTVIINKVEDEEKPYYYGKVAELDGCQTTADTLDELMKELEEVKKDYIEIKLENGDPIPEPISPKGEQEIDDWNTIRKEAREEKLINRYTIDK